MTSSEGRVAGKTLPDLHGVLFSMLEGRHPEMPLLRLDYPMKGVSVLCGGSAHSPVSIVFTHG